MIKVRMVPILIQEEKEIANYYWETSMFGKSKNIYLDCILPAVPQPGDYVELSFANRDKLFEDWKKVLEWDEGDCDNPAKDLVRKLRDDITDYSAYTDEDMLRECIFGKELDSILDDDWYVSSKRHTQYFPDKDYVVIYIENKEPEERTLPKKLYQKFIKILEEHE